jgi:hypothetical protein
MSLLLFFLLYLLGVSFAGGNFNDPSQSESFHAPGVLQTSLAILNSSQEKLDVLSFASVIVALQFPTDGIAWRENQQVQQPLGFRFHFTAQSVFKNSLKNSSAYSLKLMKSIIGHGLENR